MCIHVTYCVNTLYKQSYYWEEVEFGGQWVDELYQRKRRHFQVSLQEQNIMCMKLRRIYRTNSE